MASTITTSVVTGGTNSHATSSAEVNALATDFISQGIVGTFTANSGSGGTGSFCVNAQGTPAMFVDIKAGSAWITATPSGQASQNLRANMTADYTSYAISSNSSGSTKYDWIYLKVDATKANNPASDASDVTSLYTSRSSSNVTDNGTPPTYGVLLAVVTVANGASSITNGNITDKRVNATLFLAPAQVGTGTLANSAVTPDKLFAGTGTSWVWQSYAPVWTSSGTAPAIGAGTLSGKYIQIGKTVHFRLLFITGSTTTLGSGIYYFSLPVTAHTDYNNASQRSFLLNGYIEDAGTSGYTAIAARMKVSDANNFSLVTLASGGTVGLLSATVPFTWNNDGDFFHVSGSYEAA